MHTQTMERQEVPTKPSRTTRARVIAAGWMASAAALLIGIVSGGVANAQTTPPDPTTIGTNLANTGGNELLNVAVAVVPVLVVVLAGFWAIRLVLRKLGLGKAKI